MQQSELSLDAIRRYTGIVRSALADATALLPSDHYGAGEARPKRRALVVFCAEHGFCGAFNEPMISMAAQAMEHDKRPASGFCWRSRCSAGGRARHSTPTDYPNGES